MQTAGTGRRFTFPPKHSPWSCKALLMVLILSYADSVHSLWCGAFVEGWRVRRPFEGAVQMLEMRKDHHRGDQAARGFHGSDVSASLVCKGKRHEFEPEFAAARSRTAVA